MKPNKMYNKITLLLFIWITFQDFFLAIFYNYTHAIFLTKLLFYFKDFLLILLFSFSIFNNRFKKSTLITLFCYFLLLFILTIPSIGNYSLVTILGGIRGWILAPCLILIGYNLSCDVSSTSRIMKFFSNFFFFIAIFGIIEYITDVYLFSTIPFWKNIVGIGPFISDIKGMGKTLVYDLPGNFYGSYGNNYFSTKTLVSFYANHLTFGYVFVVPCLYLFFLIIYNQATKYDILKFVIICLAIILSYTRAIIFLLFAIMIFVAFLRKEKCRTLILLLFPVAILIAIIKFEKMYKYIFDGSFNSHILNILNGFKHISIMGNGISSVGVWSDVGTESTYLSCIGQIGIIGLTLYVTINIYPILKIKSININNEKKSFLFDICLYSLITYMISGLISEQLTGFTSIAPFYLFYGFCLKYCKNLTLMEEQNDNRNRCKSNF